MVRLLALIVLTAGFLGAIASHAQGYPSRPIRLVVPWPAGGPPDAIGRLLAQRVGDALKQQVVVDNRPGANSVIGTEIVARSAPDGYTYLITTDSHTTNAALNPKLPYDTMFASPVSMAPPIKAGRVRGLAQMGARRSHLLPDLSTLGELGIRGAEIGGWYGLYAPARTPREYTDRMLAEVQKALKEPDVREKIGNLGAEPVGMPTDEFQRYLQADIAKYQRLAQRIHLKIE